VRITRSQVVGVLLLALLGLAFLVVRYWNALG